MPEKRHSDFSPPSSQLLTNPQARGSMLIYTMFILFTLVTTSLTMVKLFLPKVRTVKEMAYSTIALYAADSATEWCLYGQSHNNVFGNMTIGTNTDSGDSGAQDASRFVTSSEGGTAIGIGIYVPAPIDTAPYNQFQMALYADDGQPLPATLASYNPSIHTNPTTLLAVSAMGTLTANSWNMVAITANISPNTVYWIGYNTNGRNSTVNNYRYTPYAAPGVPPAGAFTVWRTGVNLPTWNNPFGTISGRDTLAPANFVVYADPPAPAPVMSNGATWNIYAGSSTTPNLFCAKANSLDYQIVGSYRGISRSFKISQ